MRKILPLLFALLLVALPLSADAMNIKTGDSGLDIVLIQKRLQELDYFHFKPTGVFGGMTRTAVMRFQETNDLTASGAGVVDDHVFMLLFTPQVKRNPVPDNVKIPIGPLLQDTPEKIGEKTPWSEVKALLRPGMTLQITDYNTGSSYNMRFYGGENHAEVECATAEDYSAYSASFGGEPNWSKRPVLVTIGAKTYAASMMGMSFGADKIDENNMSGTCCLYFFGSTSDILGLPDAEHNANIERAATLDS